MRDDRVVRPPPVSAPDVPAAPEEWFEPEPEVVGEYLETHRRDPRGLVAELRGDDGEAIAPSKPSTFLDRWASEAPSPNGPSRLINKRMYPVGKDAQLLVRMYESEAADETSAAARRSASKRRVVFTTDAEDDLVLHWGVARDEPGQWLLPKETVWPADTEKVSEISVETPFIAGLGCLPAAEAAAAGGTVAEEEEECHPLQVLTLELPGEGAEELTGVQFVLRNAEGTVWYKDETNGNSNFRANYVAPGTDTSDELLDTIIRAEAGGGWWTLMHRFNLASSLLEQKCSPQAAESVASAAAAAAKIYVWLRYSQRKLTWQRNYNVKPRELSAAQSKLTRVIAKLYCESPHLRDVTRLMLGTVGKGGEGGGQGQQIRDEILNIMHRNGIPEKKGIWMEEWHQKLHNNTTPDDIIICEAYLAFLKADMDLSEYWRVLGEGGITRERLGVVRAPHPQRASPAAADQDFPHQRLHQVPRHPQVRAQWRRSDRVHPRLRRRPRRREPRAQLRSRGAARRRRRHAAPLGVRRGKASTPRRRSDEGRGRRVDSRAAVPRSRHRRRRSPRCGALGRG